MNTVDKLLSLDAGKIKRNEGVVTLELSRLGGIELEFPIIEMSADYIAELQEDSLELNLEGDVKIRSYDQKVFTIIDGCPLVFKNNEIQKHFGCQTPKDLVNKILTSGDIDHLFGEIQKLNGYDKKKDKDKVKN